MVFSGYIRLCGLVTVARGSINVIPHPVRLFMILVAIFSLIVLLLCFLCYSGDCNN